MNSTNNKIPEFFKKRLGRIFLILLLTIPQLPDASSFVFKLLKLPLEGNEVIIFRVIFGIMLCWALVFYFWPEISNAFRNRKRRRYRKYLTKKLLRPKR